jgi:hypothetical protein
MKTEERVQKTQLKTKNETFYFLKNNDDEFWQMTYSDNRIYDTNFEFEIIDGRIKNTIYNGEIVMDMAYKYYDGDEEGWLIYGNSNTFLEWSEFNDVDGNDDFDIANDIAINNDVFDVRVEYDEKPDDEDD